jgi:hypothetical protein
MHTFSENKRSLFQRESLFFRENLPSFSEILSDSPNFLSVFSLLLPLERKAPQVERNRERKKKGGGGERERERESLT